MQNFLFSIIDLKQAFLRLLSNTYCLNFYVPIVSIIPMLFICTFLSCSTSNIAVQSLDNAQSNDSTSFVSSFEDPICVHPVAEYLNQSGLQIETIEQNASLTKAMNDILSLKPEELKSEIYNNYGLDDKSWRLPDLFYAYLVPGKLCSNFESDFWKDVVSQEAKDKASEILFNIKQIIPQN